MITGQQMNLIDLPDRIKTATKLTVLRKKPSTAAGSTHSRHRKLDSRVPSVMLNPEAGSDLAHIAEKDNEKSHHSNLEVGSEVVSPMMTAVLKPTPLPKVESEENSPEYKVEEETPRESKKN
jgi:hypothetical protein